MAIATVQLPDGRIADVEVPNGATEEDLHNFLSEQFGNSQSQAPQPTQESSFLEKAGNFAKGVPQGLGEAGIGLVQTGAELGNSAIRGLERKIYGDNFYSEDSKENFNVRLADQIGKLREEQSKLPASERAGITGGKILSNIALSPTKGGFVVQGLGSGFTSGLSSAKEESGLDERLKEVGKDTAIGGTLGKGLEVAGKGISASKEGVKNIVSGITAKAPEELQIIGQQLKQKATELFDKAAQYGGSIKPKAAKKIFNDINKAVADDGPLFKTNHGDTISILKEIREDIANKGYKIGIRDLDNYRKGISDTIQRQTDKLTGAVSADGRKAILAASKLESILDNIPDNYLINSSDKMAAKLFKDGIKQYGHFRRFQRVSDLVERSGGDANLIKRNLTNFAKNKKNLQGFNSQERAAIRNSANLGAGEGIAKSFGKFGLDLGNSQTMGNTALPALGAGGAFAIGGTPAGLGVAAFGTAARQVQKYLARGKLQEALNIIQSSGNPSQVIAKIPNRKIQKKLMDSLIKGGSSAIAETN